MMNNPIELVPTISCSDFLSPVVIQPDEVASYEQDGWTVTWRERPTYLVKLDADGGEIDAPRTAVWS